MDHLSTSFCSQLAYSLINKGHHIRLAKVALNDSTFRKYIVKHAIDR